MTNTRRLFIHISNFSQIFVIVLLIVLLTLTSCGDQRTSDTYSTLSNIPTVTNISATTNTEILVTPSNSSAGTTMTPKTTLPIGWQDNWLKGVPCKPPCWEGITPGKTTLDEALKLLKQNLTITNTWTIANNDGSGGVGWNWSNKPYNKNGVTSLGGGIGYDKHQIITYIYIEPRMYKIGEIIQTYGEPNAVIAAPMRVSPENNIINYHLQFIYLNQGFALGTIFEKEPSINADVGLDRVVFFPPGTYDQHTSLDNISEQMMVPWQGFKDFRFYCRQKIFGGTDEVKDCSKS